MSKAVDGVGKTRGAAQVCEAHHSPVRKDHSSSLRGGWGFRSPETATSGHQPCPARPRQACSQPSALTRTCEGQLCPWGLRSCAPAPLESLFCLMNDTSHLSEGTRQLFKTTHYKPHRPLLYIENLSLLELQLGKGLGWLHWQHPGCRCPRPFWDSNGEEQGLKELECNHVLVTRDTPVTAATVREDGSDNRDPQKERGHF